MLTTFRRLLDLFSARERRQFWLLCILIFFMGLLELIGVASILPFLEVLSNPESIENRPIISNFYTIIGFQSHYYFLIFLGLFTFLFILLGALVKSFVTYALYRFARMREYSISCRLLAVYLRQPYAWFLGRHSADLGKTVLSEVANMSSGVMVPAMRLLAFGTIAVMLIGLLCIVHPVAALAGALIVGGGYLVVFLITRSYLSWIGADRLKANQERFQIAQEALGGVKDVKLLGLEKSYLRRFRGPSQRFARHQAASTAIGEIPRFILEAIVFGAMMAFLLITLTLNRGNGGLDQVVPVLGVFALAGARIFAALQKVYRSVSALRFNRPVLDALHADFHERDRAAKPMIGRTGGGTGSGLRLRQQIAFADVHYTYPRAEQLSLDGLDLAIQANMTVGIVGASGAGKTTAVDVLLGLLTPQRGAVVVDGTPLDAGNLRVWQNRLGYVPQQIFLIDDSIAANIALGLEADEIDLVTVERAARIAELHDFVVSELPEGYRTKVGERGVRLSGGQRQRIGIARALYHDPDVLILDEATSALDNLTERAVMDAVQNLAHAKTIVMIAHRLSTVRHCDTIFMLEHGRCVASGTYDALFERNSSFRELALAAT